MEVNVSVTSELALPSVSRRNAGPGPTSKMGEMLGIAKEAKHGGGVLLTYLKPASGRCGRGISREPLAGELRRQDLSCCCDEANVQIRGFCGNEHWFGRRRTSVWEKGMLRALEASTRPGLAAGGRERLR